MQPPSHTILIVEDDTAIRRGLVDALRFHGYGVREAADGEAGKAAAVTDGVDLVLLDLLMPRADGMAVLAEIRRSRPGLPVIIITARGEEHDRVRGLDGGADDYIVKPFSLDELLARVRAVLRRSPERPQAVRRLSIAGVTIDFERREVVRDDRTGREALSEREAAVLAYLAANRGRAIARDELLQRVWGLDPRGVQTRTIDMTIARLREALGDDPHDPRIVLTVRGKGYMLGAAADGEMAAGGAA